MKSMYGIIRYWLDTQVPMVEELAMARRSFAAICSVADVLCHDMKSGTPLASVATRLRSRLREYIELNGMAYPGAAPIKPKCHWLWDVAEQLESSNVEVNTNIIERRHLIFKAIAEPIKNVERFSESVLLDTMFSVNSRRFYKAPKTELVARADGPIAVSTVMRTKRTTIHAGDLVMLPTAIARVLSCLTQNGCKYLLVAMYESMGEQSPTSGRWRETTAPSVLVHAGSAINVLGWFFYCNVGSKAMLIKDCIVVYR